MNISKKQSLFLGLGIIALFFVLSISMLNSSNKTEEVPTAPLTQKEQEVEKARFDPSVPVTLDKFHRSEIKDGKKVWEVTAQKGRYLPQSNSADLEEAVIFFYKKENEVVELDAQHAKVFFDLASIKKAEVNGDVKLTYNNRIVITTNEAHYDHEAERIFAPGAVKIKSEEMEVVGEELTGYITSKEFVLKKNVTTTIAAKKAGK